MKAPNRTPEQLATAREQLKRLGWTLAKATERKRACVQGHRAFIQRMPEHSRHSYRLLLALEYLRMRDRVRILASEPLSLGSQSDKTN